MALRGATPKQERQYQDVKREYVRNGRHGHSMSEAKAAQFAAMTVNGEKHTPALTRGPQPRGR